VKRKLSTARRAAEDLHEGVAQHILGMLLVARSLATELTKTGSAQASKAGDLVELIIQADVGVRKVIRDLDGNTPR